MFKSKLNLSLYSLKISGILMTYIDKQMKSADNEGVFGTFKTDIFNDFNDLADNF